MKEMEVLEDLVVADEVGLPLEGLLLEEYCTLSL